MRLNGFPNSSCDPKINNNNKQWRWNEAMVSDTETGNYRHQTSSHRFRHTQQLLFGSRGFLQPCPQTLKCPPSGAENVWSLLQLFAGNSRLTCLQTSECTIIHLFVFCSVCVFVVIIWQRDGPSMRHEYVAFPRIFECSTKCRSLSYPSTVEIIPVVTA